MSKLITLIMCLACGACSTLNKFGEKKYFKQKIFNLNSQYSKTEIMYYSTTENDQHCFKDNPQNKEVITVKSEHLDFAVDHFYKRVSKINIVHSSSLNVRSIRVIATENVNFELEMASCIFKHAGGLFTDYDANYTSFRLKD